MRYRLMATYRGASYEAGIGPADGEVVLFAACPPPEELGFEPATGHWRKELRLSDVQAVWESRPVGTFRGDRCIVLDDLGDRLHIGYLGHDAYRAEQLGYWQVDRGVFELVAGRDEVTDIVEERTDYPYQPDSSSSASHPAPQRPADSSYSQPGPSYPPAASHVTSDYPTMGGRPEPARTPSLDALDSGVTVPTPAAGPPLPLEAEAMRAASAASRRDQPASSAGPTTGAFPAVGSVPAPGPSAAEPSATGSSAGAPSPTRPSAAGPAGAGPSGAALPGAAPSGAASSGAASSGTASSGTGRSGARPAGASPSGAGLPAAGFPAAGQPAPGQPAPGLAPAARSVPLAGSSSSSVLQAAPVAAPESPAVPAGVATASARPGSPAGRAATVPATGAFSAGPAGRDTTAHGVALADSAMPGPVTDGSARSGSAITGSARPGSAAPGPAFSGPAFPGAGLSAGLAGPAAPPRATPPARTAPPPSTTAPAGAATPSSTTAPPRTTAPAGLLDPPSATSPVSTMGPASNMGPSSPMGPSSTIGPSGETGPASAAGPAGATTDSPRRRRLARRRMDTERIFGELASQAAIPAASYSVGEEVEGAMCLLETADGFEVFSSAGGSRHEVRVFSDEESACFYLFGVLAADAVRTGALVPGPGRAPAAAGAADALLQR
jgi:hypothetical protein